MRRTFRAAGWKLVVAASLSGLVGCGHKPAPVARTRTAPGLPPSSSASTPNPAPTTGMGGGDVGLPVARLEVPIGSQMISTETGMASWYGTIYNKHPAANGEIFDKDAMTAASRTIPLGALARVTILATGKTAVVRINDRGPFIPGRIVDLSEAAAKLTGLYRLGVAEVRVDAFEPPGVTAEPGRWCVQIGAFVDYDDAVTMRNDLARRNQTAKVIAFKGPTGSWVRLTLPVPDKGASAKIAATVRVPDPGVEAYVTRLN